jgi:hypothetical protein
VGVRVFTVLRWIIHGQYRRAILLLGDRVSTISSEPKRRHASRPYDRVRDENDEIRHKRGDTLVGTLRREYGDDFARGFRGDSRLATVLEETNSTSLSDYLRRRPAPGRPATARDTAKTLGVSETRADRLIKHVNCELDSRCRDESGEIIRRKRTDVGTFVVEKKTGSKHAKTNTRTDRSKKQR